MKHEDAILKLLIEGRSYSYIQAQLGVYPSQIAAIVNKYFEHSITNGERRINRELNELGQLVLEANQLSRKPGADRLIYWTDENRIFNSDDPEIQASRQRAMAEMEREEKMTYEEFTEMMKARSDRLRFT